MLAPIHSQSLNLREDSQIAGLVRVKEQNASTCLRRSDGSCRDPFHDLSVFGKPVFSEPGKHQFAVNGDIKNATPTGNQFRFHLEPALDFSRQTGGSRQVISLAAVGNRDFHLREKVRDKVFV